MLRRPLSLRFAAVALITLALSGPRVTGKDEPSAFVFDGVEYFHRWSQADQHEFTPAKQKDLDRWVDMVTINGYPAVNDAKKLADAANAVLGNYQTHGADVLKTDSVSRTMERPAAHFISALFSRPAFAEAAFARFALVDGKGYSFVYSHRIYGAEAKKQMETWIAAKANATEKVLMEWKPSLDHLGGNND
jgi:hypothetical protein